MTCRFAVYDLLIGLGYPPSLGLSSWLFRLAHGRLAHLGFPVGCIRGRRTDLS